MYWQRHSLHTQVLWRGWAADLRTLDSNGWRWRLDRREDVRADVLLLEYKGNTHLPCAIPTLSSNPYDYDSCSTVSSLRCVHEDMKAGGYIPEYYGQHPSQSRPIQIDFSHMYSSPISDYENSELIIESLETKQLLEAIKKKQQPKQEEIRKKFLTQDEYSVKTTILGVV